jgi:hypothetical protein
MKGLLPPALLLPVLSLAVLSACSRCGTSVLPDPGSDSGPVGVVIARVNGLPVYAADFEDALRSGRLGGSPELILDELMNLTLALHECRVLESGCDGPGTLLARVEPFLVRLYPAADVCGPVSASDRAAMFGRLRGRRLAVEADPEDPGVRMRVESEICEARAKQLRRTYVSGLRKGARVEVDRVEVDRIVKSTGR